MLNLIQGLLQSSPYVFGLLVMIVLIITNEAGLRLGLLRRARNGDKQDEATGIVVGAVLALLAFALALNLSNAGSRFEQRQSAALDEANAISTAWLQAGAVGGTRAKSLQGLIGEYLKVRYAYVASPPDDAAIDGYNQETTDLQNEIWADLTALVTETPAPATSSLMNAINTMFDDSQKMRYVMNYHMPPQIVGLLLGMTIIGMASIGYQFGQMGQRGRKPAFMLALLWTVVVVQIFDIGMSRIWSMQADVRAYRWTMQSMGIPTGNL